MVHYDNRWPRILFLDAYDSFTNNIIDLVKDSINAQVTVIKIDDTRYLNDDEAFENLLARHDAVVAGPGPGSPTVKRDVGLIAKLWALEAHCILPVLGICLGFQSLAYAFGASIQRLNAPRHGIVGRVSHKGRSIFRNAGQVRATQYHSLHANTGHGLRALSSSAQGREAWSPSAKCPDLNPLAWVFDDIANGAVLMAIEHSSKPFWGLQYHPESICTNDEGKRVVQCWWIEAMAWTHKQNRQRESKKPRRDSTSSQAMEKKRPPKLEFSIRIPKSSIPEPGSPATELLQKLVVHGENQPIPGRVNWTELPSRNLTVLDLQQLLGTDPSKGETVVLESGTRNDGSPVNPETGRFSILACLDGNNDERLQYSSSTRELLHINKGEPQSVKIPPHRLWKYLKSYMKQKKAVRGPSSVPFWGGLVGFVSYEACLESIDVEPIPTNDEQPTMYFVFVSRSIVIDHARRKLYIQTIKQDDQAWLTKTARTFQRHPEDRFECPLESSHNQSNSRAATTTTTTDRQKKLYNLERKLSLNISSISNPTFEDYTRKISACQDALYCGESYELCLTDQTDIAVEQRTADFNIYKHVRFRNPAPFSTFMRLNTQNHRVTILGSSPERFLNWDRGGKCQFRPIKGTVKKGPGMTLKRAEQILSSSKERAENLMIVDLIRHDVHGVAGSGNVVVTKLMSVEEYETVYQLVSVVEGEIAQGSSKSGIDVLAASLPPGSMTGAPKRRSCEILSNLERKPRGIYSGVLGYLDVGGGGDFSVVIRTAYKWERTRGKRQNSGDGFAPTNLQTWSIGAGGAITIQSNEEDEWEEMLTKREAILSTFIGD